MQVEMHCATRGANIFYTTNGAAPVPPTAQRYDGPVRVARTTTFRAAAFKGDKEVGTSCASTYIFLADTIHQTGSGFPKTWGTKEGKAIEADYEMDSEIVGKPEYRGLKDGLKAIPTLTLTLAPEDLFAGERGIYSHPEESGEAWERGASLELFTADGRTNLQAGCGVRIQGGWNRRPEESPKHSFRLVFRKKYGAGKLRYPIFGEAHAAEFDSLILRAGCNNSWLHWSGVERRRGEYIRDQWMRETMGAMGHPSASGIFVHLYLNGLYWGIYNLTERPDASFASAYLGGSPEDYDARNAEKIIAGDGKAWEELMARINQGVKNREQFDAIGKLLDLPNFIDFMIVNLYGANGDWDRHSNWYAARRRNPPGKFEFFIWDAERTLEQATDDTFESDDDESPTRIFHRLCENEGFRKIFSERVKMHLSEGGALAPPRAAERYRRWSDQLDLAIIAESARWGDYRRDVHRYREGPYELYTRDGHWKPEVDRLLKEYFPARTEIFLKQCQKRQLAVGAP